MKKLLCFKQTRNMHESGYRYIEYGYIYGKDGKEVVEVVGRYDVLQSPYVHPISFNLDLTKSGWFRIMPGRGQELEWHYGGEIKVKEG